jgi:soluble cytochrome b562
MEINSDEVRQAIERARANPRGFSDFRTGAQELADRLIAAARAGNADAAEALGHLQKGNIAAARGAIRMFESGT